MAQGIGKRVKSRKSKANFSKVFTLCRWFFSFSKSNPRTAFATRDQRKKPVKACSLPVTWQVLYHCSASLSFTDYQQTLAPQLNLEAFIEQARAYDMISKDSFETF